MTYFDVPTILNELESLGVKNSDVAKKLNVYRSSVCRWKKGGEIKLSHWRQLIGLREKISKRVAYQATT